jgi:hypothetical protein
MLVAKFVVMNPAIKMESKDALNNEPCFAESPGEDAHLKIQTSIDAFDTIGVHCHKNDELIAPMKNSRLYPISVLRCDHSCMDAIAGLGMPTRPTSFRSCWRLRHRGLLC